MTAGRPSAPRARRASRPRLGSADSPVPVVQKTRAARIASRSSSSPPASCPAPWARDRRAAGSRRAGRSRRRRPGCAAPGACRRSASSTPKPRSAARTYGPNGSSPTFVITAARAPSRAAATATFVGLPPSDLANVDLGQRDADLLRVEVDADAAHRDQVVWQSRLHWWRSRASCVSRSGGSTPSSARSRAVEPRVVGHRAGGRLRRRAGAHSAGSSSTQRRAAGESRGRRARRRSSAARRSPSRSSARQISSPASVASSASRPC